MNFLYFGLNFVQLFLILRSGSNIRLKTHILTDIWFVTERIQIKKWWYGQCKTDHGYHKNLGYLLRVHPREPLGLVVKDLLLLHHIWGSIPWECNFLLIMDIKLIGGFIVLQVQPSIVVVLRVKMSIMSVL